MLEQNEKGYRYSGRHGKYEPCISEAIAVVEEEMKKQKFALIITSGWII